MKKIYVPTENNNSLEGRQKVMYANMDNGKFTRIKYSSKIEEFATKTAVEEYNILGNEALERYKNKISSPIEFFMYKNRMDIQTLAQATGFFKFNIKRHLKYEIFLSLSEKKKRIYCDLFNIDLEILNNLEEYAKQSKI